MGGCTEIISLLTSIHTPLAKHSQKATDVAAGHVTQVWPKVASFTRFVTNPYPPTGTEAADIVPTHERDRHHPDGVYPALGRRDPDETVLDT